MGFLKFLFGAVLTLVGLYLVVGYGLLGGSATMARSVSLTIGAVGFIVLIGGIYITRGIGRRR